MVVDVSAVPTPQPVSVSAVDKSRRAAGKTGTNRRSRKVRQPHGAATKDLGRWKPTDDLALVIGVQQVCK